jgi:broad specificity phosphatase PhoE
MKTTPETVFLVRHGITEWNDSRRRQGRLDSPLTEAGMRQAQQSALRLTTLCVDALFTSPLGRARVTAAVLAERLDLEPVVVDDLQEMDHGDMSGLTSAEIEDAHPGALERRRADLYHWRFPNGESYSDADVRAVRAIATIGDSGAQRPVIVAHEMVARMLLRVLLDLQVEDALSLQHPHDVIYEVDVGARSLRAIQVGPT